MESPVTGAVRLEILPSDVAVITFDLPGSPVNVLSSAVMAEFNGALDRVSKNLDIKALIITSGKTDSFIAGADLNEIAAMQNDREHIVEVVRLGKSVFDKLEELSGQMRVVAAINGICLGGGTELALACGIRIAVADAGLGLPEVGLGFLPGLGGCVRLTKLLGAQTALTVINMPLKRTDASKAWKMGWIDEVVKDGKLMERAEAIALGSSPKRAKRKGKLMRFVLDRTPMGRAFFASQAKKSIAKEAGKNYPAPPAVLKVVMAALKKSPEAAFELETQLFADLATTDVSHNLVGTYFAIQQSKKPPQNATPNIDVRTVGVAGAGVMGASIAQVALYAGYQVVLYDKFPEGLKKGAEKIVSLFDYLVKKRKITREEKAAYLANLSLSTDIAGLKHCDLVVEAIIEDMGKKKEFIAALEAAKNGKPYIFASNTSSLSIAEMTAGMKYPQNNPGLHFFNPAERLPLVEVVASPNTSPEAVASAMDFVSHLSGKYTVVTANAPGFVVNRNLIPCAYETIKLVEMGVPPEEIEAAMLDFGMKMGPFRTLDEVGLDVAGKVLHILNEALGPRLAPPKLLTWIEGQKGLLGKKSGKGMFIWENGEAKGFNPEVLAALNVQPRSMPREEIQKRLVMVMINEASRVLEEGVVSSASQVDLAMVMGCGFPPFRGGILRHADTIGAAKVVETLTELQAVAGDNYKPSAKLLEMAKTGAKFYN